ncbi:ATP-binding cassette domain-containing protein [Listeria sp. ILCC792]|uniref:ATP-binding cassette domain-containing protein n=1 Tax=Listeria sp. ILCC792 TaxID=1918331 RepID=UPI000B59392A|nr:ABC transporter ATP-binding protein [Listeria sp. ILCC792]
MIKLVDVKKKFRESGLENVSFKLPNQGLYILYGKSGSGKTTILNLLASLDKPDSGDVIMSNHKSTYMMQTDMLFYNLTVKENLLIKLNVTTIDKKNYEHDLLNLCILLGIESLLNEQVAVLSGGEKQRVAFARTMLGESDVILLDEPTSELDLSNKNQIMEYLKKISQKKLVIIASHDNEIKNFADKVILMKDGRVDE